MDFTVAGVTRPAPPGDLGSFGSGAVLNFRGVDFAQADWLVIDASDNVLLSLLNFGVMAEGFCIFIFGDLVTLCMGAKRPKFASQRKYLLPSTAPSFFPIAASNSTPAHSPFAKSVGPRYLKQGDTFYGIQSRFTSRYPF